MAEKREPTIGQEDRPTAIDYDIPIADFKLRDLVSVIRAHLWPEKEFLKPEKEFHKPEKELFKSEKEHYKPEKEYWKPEHFKPEHYKPEKEVLKPEKELLKPELSKPGPEVGPEVIEQIATRVADILKRSSR